MNESVNLPSGGNETVQPSTELDNPANLNFWEPDDDQANPEQGGEGIESETDEAADAGQESDLSDGHTSQEALDAAWETASMLSPGNPAVRAGDLMAPGAKTAGDAVMRSLTPMRTAAKAIGTTPKALKTFSKTASDDGLTASDLMSNLSELGADGRFMDLGPGLQGKAAALAASANQRARSIIRSTLQERQTGAKARMNDAINSTLGPVPDLSMVRSGLQAQADALAMTPQKATAILDERLGPVRDLDSLNAQLDALNKGQSIFDGSRSSLTPTDADRLMSSPPINGPSPCRCGFGRAGVPKSIALSEHKAMILLRSPTASRAMETGTVRSWSGFMEKKILP